MSADVIGLWVGAILTLFVFSYLLRDSPLFRIAQAVFVGVAVGYAATAAVYLVLLPRLVFPLAGDFGTRWYLLVPLGLGLLLLLKARTAWAPFGNLPVAFLFGVGSAIAIGGALTGTLIPQLAATVVSLSPYQDLNTLVSNLLLVVGTLGAFLSFRFMTNPQRPAARIVDGIGWTWGRLGSWFILVAFGAIFASTAVSRVSILIGRVYYLLHDWLQIVR